MKGLEILKDIRNIETEYNHLKKHRFDQAIEELEELENRSCDNCKKRPSPFSECPCWSYSFGKANISLCSEWEAKK